MADRLIEVTWPALLALVDANPNHPSYIGVGIGNIKLPDATYWAMAPAWEATDA